MSTISASPIALDSSRALSQYLAAQPEQHQLEELPTAARLTYSGGNCLVELATPAAPLLIPDTDRVQLEQWVRSSTAKTGLVARARIVLPATDGVAHAQIAMSEQIMWR